MNCAKKIKQVAMAFLFCGVFAISVWAEDDLAQKTSVPILQTHEHVVDLGRLLSPEEKKYLEAKIDEIVQRQNFDVVVLTTDSLNGLSREAYADDFYDYNYYGIGKDGTGYGYDRDGVLLLVKMSGGPGNRDIHISTRGFGIEAFTYAGCDWLMDRLIPLLLEGEFATAFDKFASYAEQFVTQARTGRKFEGRFMPERFPFDDVLWLLVGLVAGTIVALVVFVFNKSKLNLVAQKTTASGYEKPGSLKITNASERFLYRNVSRVYSPQQKPSGGGSHTSSSGASHGGGGRSF